MKFGLVRITKLMISMEVQVKTKSTVKRNQTLKPQLRMKQFSEAMIMISLMLLTRLACYKQSPEVAVLTNCSVVLTSTNR